MGTYSVVTYDCDCRRSPGHRRGSVGSCSQTRSVKCGLLLVVNALPPVVGTSGPVSALLGVEDSSLCTLLTPSCCVMAPPPQMSRVGATGTRADGQCPGLWGGPEECVHRLETSQGWASAGQVEQE